MTTRKFFRSRAARLVAVLVLLSLLAVSASAAPAITRSGAQVTDAVDQSLRTGQVDSVQIWLTDGTTRQGSAATLRAEYGWFPVSPPYSCAWSGLHDMPTASGTGTGWGCTLPNSVHRPGAGNTSR